MYHHSFLLVIVSDNDHIEKTLQDIPALEDCDYTFQTVSSHAEIPSSKPDVAFIYDSIGGVDFSGARDKYNMCALVTASGNPLLKDPATVSDTDDIWFMPGDNYDDGLLTVYFQRLARRMKRRADNRKQAICFETVLDSTPDVAWFKDTSGVHLIVNDSFCDMVGKTKEQIYKQGHCYIWDASKEDEQICLNSDKAVMESRKTNVFEESVKTATDMRMLKSYKTALIDVDGTLFGTCGIGHDVTKLLNMDTELDIVLNSVPFAVMMESAEDIVLNKNHLFDRYFPDFKDIIGKSSAEWKQSLSKKLLLNDKLMEVVIPADDENKVLVYEEEPILDVFKKTKGKIVTLMDITLTWTISQKNEHIANTDYLTGLHNRRDLMHYLEDLYNRADVTLIMTDLDNFKHVNDTYGHEAGDRALVMAAEMMKTCFKEDFIARMGGDEFLIVTTGKDLDTVVQEAGDLLETLRTTFHKQEEFDGVTTSIGILPTAAVPEPQRTISDLLETVDQLLYKAKETGKNHYCIYGEE